MLALLPFQYMYMYIFFTVHQRLMSHDLVILTINDHVFILLMIQSYLFFKLKNSVISHIIHLMQFVMLHAITHYMLINFVSSLSEVNQPLYPSLYVRKWP